VVFRGESELESGHGSKNLFPNFGTLQGDAIDSSNPYSHSSGDPLPPDSLRSRIAKVAMARKLAVRLYWMWRNSWQYSQLVEFGSNAGKLVTGHGVK
jgi:hypothetical protein